MSAPLTLTVNGVSRTVAPEAGETLLDVLRDRLDLRAAKNGCQPQGQCGCCTVEIDGRAQVSCVMSPEKCVGREVRTLEGVPEATRRIFADAFVLSAGLQCGFCIPGIVMRGVNLVEKNPKPTRDEIAKSLNGHICRCTGYVKIVDAIELAAAALRGEPMPVADESGHIGTSMPRYDGYALTLGERPYIDDLNSPGQLFGAIRHTDHPRAKVLGIDASAAKAMPGVRAVLTAADVPGQRYQGLIEKDWPVMVAVGEYTRYVGDVLACVAADTALQARAAAEAIRVDYHPLEAISDPRRALDDDAPPLHEGGNLLSRSSFQRGDAGAALRESKHTVEETFSTQRIEQAFLEPESAIAVPHGFAPPAGALPSWAQPPEGGLLVYSQGQGVFDDRRQLSSVLALPEARVAVQLVANGGAFGGKEDLSIQSHASLLALATKRPVKLTLSRDESMRMHPKRHPVTMTYTVGCDADGRITAVKARMIGDKGAYASVGAKVLERAAGHATGPYKVPHLDVEALAVYTNNPPCGAMRGFGANQAAFAMEQCLDMLAEKAGLNRWEIRWRNAVDVGDLWGPGQILEGSVGLKKTLLSVKDDFLAAKYAGIACGIKNVGIGNGLPELGHARIRVAEDGVVEIHNGYTEMGQGLYTVFVQIAAEATGLDPKNMRVHVDTRRAVDCGMTTASRATWLGGAAVRAAAELLKAALDAGATLEGLRGQEFIGRVDPGKTDNLDDVEPGKPMRLHHAFGFATQVVILDDEGKLSRVIAAHDVGRALNPKLCEGQLEGSVHMGLGYALTEEFKCGPDARPVSTKFLSLGLLRAKDMPKVDVRLIEEHDPRGPYGAKGVGEIGLVPTAPAVAGALHAFDGRRRTVLPMKDSPAAKSVLGTRK